jgi:acyl-CoA reductase-like NAD-dependent aldehyde dehydrogenase
MLTFTGSYNTGRQISRRLAASPNTFVRTVYARNNRYRLAGAVITRDPDLTWRFSNDLKAGQFNWNAARDSQWKLPSVGFGDSGNAAKEGIETARQRYMRMPREQLRGVV